MEKKIGNTNSELIEIESQDQLSCRASHGEINLLNLLPVKITYVDRDLLNGRKVDLEKEMVSIYHTIESRLSETEKKTIQFLGSREGEGTTTIIREFARVAAIILGKSVLLLDTDIDQNISNSPPTEELNNKPDSFENQFPMDFEGQTEEHNSSPGSISIYETSLPGIFNSPYIDQLIDRLKQQFDLILVDSPPASCSPDIIAIARKVEGVILILEAENTRGPVVENVKDKIENVGGKILGVILNKQRHYIPSFIYDLLYKR